ncbi:hypothetical protein JB92DRAFT_3127938 [Gautieria morchelliformis]|nr:hypothetical protein JB92DRAFT_3127938 [Gautieria morchelliformis]
MGREFLLGVGFRLYVSAQTYKAWVNLLKGLVLVKEWDEQQWQYVRQHASGVPMLAQTPRYSASHVTAHQHRARSSSPLPYLKAPHPFTFVAPASSNPFGDVPRMYGESNPTWQHGGGASERRIFIPIVCIREVIFDRSETPSHLTPPRSKRALEVPQTLAAPYSLQEHNVPADPQIAALRDEGLGDEEIGEFLNEPNGNDSEDEPEPQPENEVRHPHNVCVHFFNDGPYVLRGSAIRGWVKAKAVAKVVSHYSFKHGQQPRQIEYNKTLAAQLLEDDRYVYEDVEPSIRIYQHQILKDIMLEQWFPKKKKADSIIYGTSFNPIPESTIALVFTVWTSGINIKGSNITEVGYTKDRVPSNSGLPGDGPHTRLLPPLRPSIPGPPRPPRTTAAFLQALAALNSFPRANRAVIRADRELRLGMAWAGLGVGGWGCDGTETSLKIADTSLAPVRMHAIRFPPAFPTSPYVHATPSPQRFVMAHLLFQLSIRRSWTAPPEA